jgi:hypothetical protein
MAVGIGGCNLIEICVRGGGGDHGTLTWADLGRVETFSTSPSGIVDRQRRAGADYRFRLENSQDNAR